MNSETQSQRAMTNRSRSPRGRKHERQHKKPLTHLEIVFKAIQERPLLDNMTREERIREKLRFFNLETETLEASRKRINKKVAMTTTRFGPRSSNMAYKKSGPEEKAVQYNPFEEMMAIEAEFGSVFSSHESLILEEGRANSKWYPFFESIS